MVLLLAWLVGVALGIAGLSVVVMLLAAAAFGLGAVRHCFQLAITTALLICLGYVWGGYAGISGIGDCNFEPGATGGIIGQPRIEAERVLVVIQSEHSCRALVTTGRFSELEEGDVLELTGGQVQSLQEVRDYSAGYAGYLERRGISATWRYPNINVAQPSSNWTNMLHDRVRERVTSLFIEPDASVVLAVLLAEKGTLPDQLVEQFRTTGVSHVLAISGLHISLLTGMLLAVLMALPLAPRVRTVVVLAWLWSYVVFIGWPTSATRAAAFWTIALVALQLHVLVSLPTILLLAATVLVSLDPLFLLDVGFQLSISAVAGIFIVLFLTRDLPKRSWVLDLTLVSLGAWLATGPVIAYHFGNVVLSGVMTNLLVVPLVPALLVLAVVALLLSLVFMPAAMLMTWLTHGVIGWIDWATSLISAQPGLFYEGVNVPVWSVFVYYLVMIGLGGVVLRYQKRNWREIWQ